MRNKSLYLLVACVCGTVAAILASQWLKAQANEGTNLEEIFVAVVAIDVGEKITPEKIQLEQWPAGKAPKGSTSDLKILENKYAKQRFYVGEAIMPVKLMDENWSTVPKGFRVVAMKAADVTIANLIQPGDRVDVMAYFNRSELIPRSMTKTVLMGVRVYALDGDTERKVGEDRPKSLRTIQLLIHEKDAEAWTYANELGKVRLSLGSDADYSNDDGSNEAGQEFLSWIEEHRIKKEEAERLAELEKQRSKAKPPATNDQSSNASPEEEGFLMIKMVGDRMIEYRIIPGQLPIFVREIGGEGSSSGSGSATSNEITSPSTDTPASEYDYLNGESSPFFESEEASSIDE